MTDQSGDAPASPLPPDPFAPADIGFALLVTEFRGLRKAGAGLAEAALIVAAHCVINSMTITERQPPD